MKIQIIHDGDGNYAGVFIPYAEWDMLKKQHKDLAALEEENTPGKKAIVNNIKRGLKELKQFKKGKLKTTPAKDFLNEL